MTNLNKYSKNVVKFYNGRGTAEYPINEGKNAVRWTKISWRTKFEPEKKCQKNHHAPDTGGWRYVRMGSDSGSEWSRACSKWEIPAYTTRLQQEHCCEPYFYISPGENQNHIDLRRSTLGKIYLGVNMEFVRHDDKSFEWGVAKAAELGYDYVEPMVHWGRELLSEAGLFPQRFDAGRSAAYSSYV